jgi:hypothetical protein
MVTFPDLYPSGLTVTHFRAANHQRFFEALSKFDLTGELSYPVVASEAGIDPIFAIDHLMPCHVPTRVWGSELCRRLDSHHQYSKVAPELQECLKLCVASDDPMIELRTRLSILIDKFGVNQVGGAGSSLIPLASTALKGLVGQKDAVTGKRPTAFSTGFETVDQLIGGFRNSELILLAAEAGAGKSTLLLNVLANFAAEYGPVAFFSAEMSEEQMAEKISRSEMGLGHSEIPTVRRIEFTKERIESRPGALARIFVDYSPKVSAAHVLSMCQQSIEGAFSAIAVDHLRHWNTGREEETEYQSVSDSVTQLKLLAKQAAVPVVVVVHLSRSRMGQKKPSLEMLRGSGRLEDVADTILSIWPIRREDGSRERTDLYVLKARS